MEFLIFLAIFYFLFFRKKPEKRKEHREKIKESWKNLAKQIEQSQKTGEAINLNKIIQNASQNSEYANRNTFRQKQFEERKKQPWKDQPLPQPSKHDIKPRSQNTVKVSRSLTSGVVNKGLFDRKDSGKTVDRR
ncbi:MAG: hypothetical protein AAF988_02600 [Pseudomonadota bacterium]